MNKAFLGFLIRKWTAENNLWSPLGTWKLILMKKSTSFLILKNRGSWRNWGLRWLLDKGENWNNGKKYSWWNTKNGRRCFETQSDKTMKRRSRIRGKSAMSLSRRNWRGQEFSKREISPGWERWVRGLWLTPWEKEDKGRIDYRLQKGWRGRRLSKRLEKALFGDKKISHEPVVLEEIEAYRPTPGEEK